MHFHGLHIFRLVETVNAHFIERRRSGKFIVIIPKAPLKLDGQCERGGGGGAEELIRKVYKLIKSSLKFIPKAVFNRNAKLWYQVYITACENGTK